MRLVRFSAGGVARLGALVDDGRSVVDLQAAAAAQLAASGDALAESEAALRLPGDTALFLRGGKRSSDLARTALRFALDNSPHLQGLILPQGSLRLEAPLRPSLVVCGGANFRDHLEELGREKPEQVEFFFKNPNTVLGPDDDIPYRPWASRKLDYEAELGIVIGRTARGVPREHALDYVFGYTAVNDMAVRDRQLFRWDGPYFHVKYGDGKVFDGNLVLGPSIVTAEEVPDPMSLPLRCWVDGELRQSSNTSRYIWGVAEVVEYYSRMITLEPGFLICPGTPGGCAVGTDPDCGGRTAIAAPGSYYMQPGQRVVIEVEGIGRLDNRVCAAKLDELRKANVAQKVS